MLICAGLASVGDGRRCQYERHQKQQISLKRGRVAFVSLERNHQYHQSYWDTLHLSCCFMMKHSNSLSSLQVHAHTHPHKPKYSETHTHQLTYSGKHRHTHTQPTCAGSKPSVCVGEAYSYAWCKTAGHPAKTMHHNQHPLGPLYKTCTWLP